jgi:hypothetical protein
MIKTISKGEPFKLGFCNCGCGANISLRTKRGYLARYVNGHSRPKVKYNCNKCKDQNWLVSCKCGCNDILFHRDEFYEIREFKQFHAIRIRDQSGVNNTNWKGGNSFNKKTGYWTTRIPNHPRASPYNGRIASHKLVYEQYLSIIFDEEMFIPSNYDVHHINGNKQDNSLINLTLLTHSEHAVVSNYVDTSNRICANPECRDREAYPNRFYIKDGFGGYYCNRCYLRINAHKWRKKSKK